VILDWRFSTLAQLPNAADVYGLLANP